MLQMFQYAAVCVCVWGVGMLTVFAEVLQNLEENLEQNLQVLVEASRFV